MFLKIPQNSQKNACARKSFLIKRLWDRWFPVNYAKFLRTLFLKNNSGWLLLYRFWLISDKHAPYYNFYDVLNKIWKPQFLWWNLFSESGNTLMKKIFLPWYSTNYLINTNMAPTINIFKYHLSILIYTIGFIDFIEFKRGRVPTAVDKRRIAHVIKMKFFINISLVSMSKPAGNCGFVHIYWRNS